MAGATEMEVIDLRPALGAEEQCRYQPHNMHWLEEGHRIAADAVLSLLTAP